MQWHLEAAQAAEGAGSGSNTAWRERTEEVRLRGRAGTLIHHIRCEDWRVLRIELRSARRAVRVELVEPAKALEEDLLGATEQLRCLLKPAVQASPKLLQPPPQPRWRTGGGAATTIIGTSSRSPRTTSCSTIRRGYGGCVPEGCRAELRCNERLVDRVSEALHRVEHSAHRLAEASHRKHQW